MKLIYVLYVFVLINAAAPVPRVDKLRIDPRIDFLRKSNGYFSVQLYKEIKSRNANIVISPLGLNFALTSLILSTGGETNKELRKALNQPDDLRSLIVSYGKFANLVTKHTYTPKTGQDSLKIATEWFIDREHRVRKQFRQIFIRRLLTGIQYVDFSSKPKESQEVISKFVDKFTNHKIPKVVFEGSILQDAVFVVVNVVLFQSGWEIPFSPSMTEKKDFYGFNGKSKVDMMCHKAGKFKYAQDDGLNAQLLELPLTSGSSFLIILPNEIKGLREVEESIIGHCNNKTCLSPFSDIFERTQYTNLDVYLPKFNIVENIELLPALRKMGIKRIFSEEANFKRLSTSSMYLDDISQKTFVRVNEFGIDVSKDKDSPVTRNIKEESAPISATKVFNINHPFIFIITDKFTNTPLLIGKYIRPTGER